MLTETHAPPMRFLMLNWRDPKNPLAGGAERVSAAYLAALVKRGHECFWFSFDFEGALPEETIDGIRIVRSGGVVTSTMAARRWIKRQAPFDLVIDQHHGLPWFAPWWAGARCVAYIHEVLGPIWSAFYPWPVSLMGRIQERWTHWIYRRTPFFTGCKETRRQLYHHGVKDVSIVNYGTDVRALDRLPKKRLEAPYRLIVVSRLAPNKRINHALELVVELLQRKLPVELTIVGDGDEERKLKKMVPDLNIFGRVRFAGRLSEADKNEELKNAHFIVHTSQREGWGLNVTEANAMGTPGAVYPVAGLTESTLNNETGIISEKETPASLADRIEQALINPDQYDAWRLTGRDRARRLHWDSILPRACDWFEAMARGETPILESE
jgi:glycosyltransferase involved in cell wall biosynthesis